MHQSPPDIPSPARYGDPAMLMEVAKLLGRLAAREWLQDQSPCAASVSKANDHGDGHDPD